MIQTLSKPKTSTVLKRVRWETHQALVLDLGENPAKKLIYDQGTLDIMTPLPEHEINKRFLGRIVKTTSIVFKVKTKAY